MTAARRRCPNAGRRRRDQRDGCDRQGADLRAFTERPSKFSEDRIKGRSGFVAFPRPA
jgi:hypothetical protein